MDKAIEEEVIISKKKKSNLGCPSYFTGNEIIYYKLGTD